MDILTVVLSAAAVLASAISAFVASAALAGIKKAQAELQKQTEQQKQASERLMLAQQQRREELASLEARINKSITDSAEAGRREQGEAIDQPRATKWFQARIRPARSLPGRWRLAERSCRIRWVSSGRTRKPSLRKSAPPLKTSAARWMKSCLPYSAAWKTA